MKRIISERVEEMMEMVRERMKKQGIGNIVGKRVVMKGGERKIKGMKEEERRIIERNVRIGSNIGIEGLKEEDKGEDLEEKVGIMI